MRISGRISVNVQVQGRAVSVVPFFDLMLTAMGIKEILLVVLYLTSIVAAGNEHEPQVYEELHEDMPEIIRKARHLDNGEDIYQPPVFNYRTARQQDRIKTRYHRQQQADFRHLKINPIHPDKYFEFNQHSTQHRGPPMRASFQETGGDWKPFQPKYVASLKATSKGQEVVGKTRFAEKKQNVDVVHEQSLENDLDIAGSENKEQRIEENVADTVPENIEEMTKTDRDDQNSRYIYVQPNILRNNFGLDAKTTQEVLQNSAPSANSEEFQINELKELLGKNPEYQLQGLQKLLEDAKPVMENQVSIQGGDVEIPTNSLPTIPKPTRLSTIPSNQPPIEDLQKQLDAVNQAHAQAALAAAQEQAEAHVRAQHQAIALAQKRAEEEALAKIAAHNEGRTMINSNSQILDGVMPITAAPLKVDTPRPKSPFVQTIIHQIEENSLEAKEESADESAPAQSVNTHETSALNARPYEQLLLHQPSSSEKGYAPSFTDLRNSKPIINLRNIPQPSPFTNHNVGPPLFRPLAAVPEIYAPSEIQNYSPINPLRQIIDVQEIQQIPPQSNHFPGPTKSTFVPLPTASTLQEHRQDSYQEVNVDTSHSSKHPRYSDGKHDQYDDVHQYAAKYAFGYRILDEKHGNDFGHEEERDGKLTKGHYFVLLPDGRRQRVEYFVDNSGYHAKVSYENVGRHTKYLPPHPREHEEHSQDSEHIVHQ